MFLDTMARIAKGLDTKIIKNVGDGLVCYFPNTSDGQNDSAFQDVIGFGVSAMAAHHNISRIMHEEKLPYAIFCSCSKSFYDLIILDIRILAGYNYIID